MGADAWIERMRASTVRSTEQAIAECALRLTDASFGLSQEQRDALQRTVAVVRHSARTILNADPALVALATHKQIEESLGAILAEMTAYESDRDASRLSSLSNAADRLLGVVNLVPVARLRRTEITQEAMQAFLDRVSEVRGRLDDELARSEEAAREGIANWKAVTDAQASEIADGLDSLRDTVAATTSEVTTLRQQISESEKQFRSAVDAEKKRVDNLTVTATGEIAELQGTATRNFQQQAVEFSEQFEEKMASLLEGGNAELLKLKERLQKVLDYFLERQRLSDQILGAEAASKTAGAYLEEARSQGRQALWWTGGAVVVWLSAIGLSLCLALQFTSSASELSVSQLVAADSARIAVGGVAVTFAVWVMKQVGHHREREREASAIASELTTLRPFIAELVSEERDQILKQVVDRYFPGKGRISGGQSDV